MPANPRLSNQTGIYRLSMQSGLLTGVAAGTATAGHLFAFRWTSAALRAYVRKIKLRWQTTTPFTAAQEMAFRVFRLTGYSAAHSTGTAATLTSPNLKTSTRFAASALADARIGGTGALTAGTHTLDAQELGGLNGWSQTGANADPTAFETVLGGDAQILAALELGANEGFIVRNEILMGAAGVGRLLVEVDWSEL